MDRQCEQLKAVYGSVLVRIDSLWFRGICTVLYHFIAGQIWCRAKHKLRGDFQQCSDIS